MTSRLQLTRRSFVTHVSAGFASSSLAQASSLKPLAHASLVNQPSENLPTYVTAGTDPSGQDWVALLNSNGKILNKLALPSRAHQIAVHPKANWLALSARRPGTYLKIIQADTGQQVYDLKPVSGHHFYGHSVFSSDGQFLYTTENHIASGEGRIFVRDSQNDFKVIRQYPSHGIGPHEIKLSPDDKTVIVANGGILTHPDSGRIKLNLDEMAPSLAYLSAQTGELLEQASLPSHLHKLSIRHIDINQSGTTVIAMQYQGDKMDHVPLVGLHKRGQTIKTLWAPEHINRKMQHYCGSICFNRSGSIFAVSSPRGDVITLWDAIDGEYITQFECNDVCGISPSGKHGFSFSNGLGKLYSFDMKSALLKELTNRAPNTLIAWDNHLTSL